MWKFSINQYTLEWVKSFIRLSIKFPEFNTFHKHITDPYFCYEKAKNIFPLYLEYKCSYFATRFNIIVKALKSVYNQFRLHEFIFKTMYSINYKVLVFIRYVVLYINIVISWSYYVRMVDTSPVIDIFTTQLMLYHKKKTILFCFP